MSDRQTREQNRRSWNAATRAHNSHKKDQAAFLAAGGTTLFPEELALLGPLAGKALVHLQCNSGQDSLCLVREGAVVTGVDISDEAIDFAQTLSEQSNLPATFVRSDVYDWLATPENTKSYDTVFCSYGAICWLPDLTAWARGVAQVLRPGGQLVLIEFHPMAWSVDAAGAWIDRYFQTAPIVEADGVSDYVADAGAALAPSGFLAGETDFENPTPATCYQWTTAQLLQALIDAGLHIGTVREYPYANGCQIHPGMVVDAHKRYRHRAPHVDPPLMLGVVAHKPKG